MGLLNLDDDTKLGLLTAALAAMSARGVRPGTALAQGGLLGINAMQQAKELRADEARKKMQEQLWQAQMAETMAQADERRAKLAREQEAAQRQAQIAAGAPRVGVPEFNTGTPGYSSGVSQAFGVPEAKPAETKVDVYAQLARKAAYLADNNDVASAEKYVDLANKMKPKYSPTLSVVLDPATNKHILVQASETEMPRPVPGMLPERKVELKDFGGSLGAVDMRDLMPGVSFPKTMTPEGKDASDRGWASNRLARDQFDYTKTKDADEAAAKAKAPAGGEKITESQGTAGVYLSMMAEANKTLEKLGGENGPHYATVNAAKSPTIGFAASGPAKQVAAAQMQWVEAALRITTGATAPPEEIVRMTRMYFPQFGDSAETVKQKNEARQAFEAGVRIKAGAAGPLAETAVGAIGGGQTRPITPAGLQKAPAGSGADYVYTPGAR